MADNIKRWLEELDLTKYHDAFVTNEIAFTDLADLTESDLKEIGLPVGPRRRAIKAIAKLAGKAPPQTLAHVEAFDGSEERQASPSAERRQLSILFCDLVGSTDLSVRLDPEDLRDIMRRYQDTVAGAVTRYGGHIAKYLGDGLLVYFGWPQAYEDQAVRAVRAALEAVRAVSQLQTDEAESLAARVGVATGQVVVGDLIGESGRDSEAVTGETPNLAARLQGVASSGEVVIDETTRQLTGQAFSLDDMGRQQFKGFQSSVQAWHVIAERTHESRFESIRGSAHESIVGRDAELQLLLERWKLTQQGEGQVVLVSGEAGIGKSRLIEAFKDTISDGSVTIVRHQCSPFHINSALYPTIQHLRRAARLEIDDDDASSLDKVEALLKDTGKEDALTVQLIANLLSIPFLKRYGALRMTPGLIKQRSFEAILDQLLILAGKGPLLFLYEDAHWIDPTSAEFLDLATSRIPEAPVLLVITHRPEWTAPRISYGNIASIHLSHLGRGQSAEIVKAIAGKSLSEEIIERIVKRTDGVPLFLEELTKVLIEGGAQAAEDDIPPTLKGSLLARLDRLPSEAKQITQWASVVGRSFSHDMVARIAAASDDELTKSLDELVQAELILRRGTPPDATYTFKHALVQDAAYESLLRSERQRVHRQIAKTLKLEFPDTVDSSPEVLARHLTEAGDIAPATEQWRRAAQKAMEKSANVEAERHIATALDLTHQLPETDARQILEGSLLNLLGVCLMPTRGFGSPEVSEAFAKAATILENSTDIRALFEAHRGGAQYSLVSNKLDHAREASKRILSLAEASEEQELVIEARHLGWSADLYSGNLSNALDQVEAGLSLYDRHRHQHLAFGASGHDPGVCCRGYGSHILCHMGQLEKSAKLSEQCVELAEEIDHPLTTAVALAQRTIFQAMQGQYEPLLSVADKLEKHCISQGLGPFANYAKVIRYHALAHLVAKPEIGSEAGSIRDGIERMRKELTLFAPRAFGMLAEAYLKSGLVAEGLVAIEEGIRLSRQGGQKLFLPELHRIRAALLLSQTPADRGSATAQLLEAVELAETMGSRLMTARALADLLGVQQSRGEQERAQVTLNKISALIADAPELGDLISLDAATH